MTLQERNDLVMRIVRILQTRADALGRIAQDTSRANVPETYFRNAGASTAIHNLANEIGSTIIGESLSEDGPPKPTYRVMMKMDDHVTSSIYDGSEEECILYSKAYDALQLKNKRLIKIVTIDQPPIWPTYEKAPNPELNPCGFVPPTLGYAPCTRVKGHEGPCAHPFAGPSPGAQKYIYANLRKLLASCHFHLAEHNKEYHHKTPPELLQQISEVMAELVKAEHDV